MSVLDELKKSENILINIRQKHWAIQLALEYIQQAYQELRDIGTE